MSDEILQLIEQLKEVQFECKKKYEINDVFSSSKFFELIIANELNHDIIGGFSGFRDARDNNGNEYEYKHYKESSQNHTWTFNDFSDSTIEKLNSVEKVVFAHIDDSVNPFRMDWAYLVSGNKISSYLADATKRIKNTRKMINISPKQLETKLQIIKQNFSHNPNGKFSNLINRVFEITSKLETLIGTKNILTSNKLWEVLVALKLNHKVLTEQTKFDAVDVDNNLYEYKVSRSYSWNFEDISDNVLAKFSDVKEIILARIDKPNFKVEAIYSVDPSPTTQLLKEKLKAKIERYENKGGIRRLQVSLSKSDLEKLNAKKLF